MEKDFFERPPDIFRSFLFKQSKIWKVGQPEVAIQPNLPMIKQIMWDWLGNKVQMTLHINFKLNSSKRIWYSLKVFLFQPGVNEWPLLPGVMNFLKIGHRKCPDWPGSNRKTTSENSLKLRFKFSSCFYRILVCVIVRFFFQED